MRPFPFKSTRDWSLPIPSPWHICTSNCLCGPTSCSARTDAVVHRRCAAPTDTMPCLDLYDLANLARPTRLLNPDAHPPYHIPSPISQASSPMPLPMFTPTSTDLHDQAASCLPTSTRDIDSALAIRTRSHASAGLDVPRHLHTRFPAPAWTMSRLTPHDAHSPHSIPYNTDGSARRAASCLPHPFLIESTRDSSHHIPSQCRVCMSNCQSGPTH